MRFFCIGVVYMNRFFREFLMKTVGYLEPVDFFFGWGLVWLVRAFHVQFYLLVKSSKFIGDRGWIFQSQKPALFCIY